MANSGKIKKSLYVIISAMVVNFIISFALILVEVLSDYSTSLSFSVAAPFIMSIFNIIMLLIEFIALMSANKDSANIYHASRAAFVAIILHLICLVLRLILYFYEDTQVHFNEGLVLTFWSILIVLFIISLITEIYGMRYILFAIDDIGRLNHKKAKGSIVVFALFIAYEVIDVISIIIIIFSYYMDRNIVISLNFSIQIALITISLLCALGLLFLTKHNFNLRLIKKNKK